MDTMVTNTSDETINGWTIAFDFDGEISNIWNAEIVKLNPTYVHFILE